MCECECVFLSFLGNNKANAMQNQMNCALLFLASVLLFLQGASTNAADADVVAPAEVVAAAPAQPNLNGMCV